MAQHGAMMCGTFVTMRVPIVFFGCFVVCGIIGGTCLGVGSTMYCYWGSEFPYLCFQKQDALVITGITFLSLSGIVLSSIICCCPKPRPNQASNSVYVMGPNGVMQSVPCNSGYSGPTGFAGGHAGPMAYNNNGFVIASPNVPVNNQQLYALVPIQQQPCGRSSQGVFQLTATTTVNEVPAVPSGSHPNPPAYPGATKDTENILHI
ncbi:hypothetical protein SK128_008458 [Halocaridina rubra]|uniref:Uncharacterized protein n=1 Tax=Halocaridina rubra TaxID=373956 RepID=A0AAN9AGE7_HALRR